MYLPLASKRNETKRNDADYDDNDDNDQNSGTRYYINKNIQNNNTEVKKISTHADT